MIVHSSTHETWFSNSWLVGSGPGGTAVIVDSGAPIEALLREIEQQGLRVTHVLNTHEHHDHTVHNRDLVERFDVPLVLADDVADGEVIEAGDLRVRALLTPGHVPAHVSWEIAPADAAEPPLVCTGDVLFRETVGGTMGGGPNGFDDLRHSILQVLLTLPADTRLLPGHAGETSVAHELEHNPFVRVWNGQDPEGTDTVMVSDQACTLVLQAGDYDGGTKAWVRFADGREAIVGGSLVEAARSTHA